MNTAFIRRSDRLAESARAYYARLDRARAGRRLVLWGAGRAGALAAELLNNAGRPPALVVDRDARLHGRRLHDARIGSIDDLVHPGTGHGDYVLLASMHAPEMAAWLRAGSWRPGADFAPFPLASIYRPEFGFALEALPAPAAPRRPQAPASVSAEKPVATIFASSAGNFYFRELRDFLVHGLRHGGWTVHAADEHVTRSEGVPIVVGPHEFFSVGRGVEWFSADNLRHAVLVTTEQPQSLWFQAFERALALAGAVLDVSPAACDTLTARGVHAAWLPLGWYPGCGAFDAVPAGLAAPHAWNVDLPDGGLPGADADPWDRRPIDILFIGSHSPRRARWIDALQAALPDANWRVHMPSDARPLSDRRDGQIDTATSVALARRAKLLLNIHRDDTPYFEWQRIVWRGLWQRTLVVSEPSGTVPGIVAGRDYVEAPVEQMAATLRALLTAADGPRHADQIRRAGCGSGKAVTFAGTEAVLAAAAQRVAGAAAPS